MSWLGVQLLGASSFGGVELTKGKGEAKTDKCEK